jgi:glycosyltransferase involved in cell wall biosynthesis
MILKVLQVSTEDNSGGASRSAYRLHQALLQENVECDMRVLTHQTANSRVTSGRAPRTLKQKIQARFQEKLHAFKNRNWHTDNPILHSFGQASAGIVSELNCAGADVLNLHWVPKLLSISDIGQLQKPIVWTLHDMWPFCGGEHYTPDFVNARFRTGYSEGNRPATERGPDLNREAWLAKRRAWKALNLSFVSPSRWMAECVENSALFRDQKIRSYVIANPLDTEEVWRPFPKLAARKRLGLAPEKKYVLAGSAGGMAQNKGEDLLPLLMAKLEAIAPDTIELLIFGRYQPTANEQWPCKVHWLGAVRDDAVMATIYSAADVMIVPSRQDNLPNTAVEAQACGTPVAAFRLGGLPDIVEHEKTGWLAPPFEIENMAKGIFWMMQDADKIAMLSGQSRALALRRYSPAVVVKQYCDVYEEAIELSR